MEVQYQRERRTVGVVFSEDELWLLQSSVRHEIPQQEQWKTPPADLDLNQQVSDAILLCSVSGEKEAALTLTFEHCLVIDCAVPQTAKSSAGVPVGRQLLLKSFRARRFILDGGDVLAEEPVLPSRTEVRERLQHLNSQSEG